MKPSETRLISGLFVLYVPWSRYVILPDSIPLDTLLVDDAKRLPKAGRHSFWKSADRRQVKSLAGRGRGRGRGRGTKKK